MAKIYYHAVPVDWRKEQKYKFLDEHESVSKIDWTEITPDAKQNWLTAGMEKEFDGFISIGNKETKSKGTLESSIFKNYSRGIETTRDNWVYNFQKDDLLKNIELFIQTYNNEVLRWHSQKRDATILDSFVLSDDTKINWSRNIKQKLLANRSFTLNPKNVREIINRPFAKQFVYFDDDLVYLPALFPFTFPNRTSEDENIIICVTNHTQVPFNVIATSTITDVGVGSRTGQAFPFYIYSEDGTNRRENITDWALEQFRENYSDTTITKWDIFYFTYAILHHPEYREKYAANLKRELPRIPFAPDFWSFAKAGKELADIHVGYEDQPEYKLDMIENGKLALDWRVDRMKYNKDKTAIVYNGFLTIGGIPPEVHEYRLGNRSALDWIVDQYKVSIDKRSGLTNDPNRDDDPQYIVRLIKKIVTVSLRTNEIVKSLPSLAD